jgi:poly-D-alanine transfer protein DltD
MPVFASLIIAILLFLGGGLWFSQIPHFAPIAAQAKYGPLHHIVADSRAKNLFYLNTYAFERPLVIDSSDIAYPPATRDPYHVKPLFANYRTPVTPLLLGGAGAQNYFSFTMMALGLADAGNPVIIYVSPLHFGAASNLPPDKPYRWDGTDVGSYYKHLDKNLVTKALANIANEEIKRKYARRTIFLQDHYRHTFVGTHYSYIKSVADGSKNAAGLLEALIRLDASMGGFFDYASWVLAEARGENPPLSRPLDELKPFPARALKRERIDEAAAAAASVSTNNEYWVYDEYWDRHVKNKYEDLMRAGVRGNSGVPYVIDDSIEWADYELLCELVKDKKLNVYFIITGVNRRFFESCGYDFSNMESIYERLEKTAEKNDIPYISLASKIAEKYWSWDIYHTGWLANVEIMEVMRDHFALEAGR